MAQICPNCSTSNEDDAALCKKCANPLPGAVAETASSNGVPRAQVTGSAPPRRPTSGAVAEAARRAAAQQRAAAQAPATGAATGATGAAGTTRNRTTGEAAAATGGRRPAPGTPGGPVTRSLNKALDDAGLPRFSNRRYLVIWAGLLAIILAVFALLIYSGGAASRAVTPTAVAGAATAGNFAQVETAKGNFKIELTTDASVADIVKNFKDKVASGFYNDLTFHIVTDALVQGGDPNGDGTGGSSIVAQYNNKPFNRGAVGMVSRAERSARVSDVLWLIVKRDSPTLNENYPNFGQVIEGMDVVDKLVAGDKITRITLADK